MNEVRKSILDLGQRDQQHGELQEGFEKHKKKTRKYWK
jgi:uncharacterized protein YjbJ (UPF0337 family)